MRKKVKESESKPQIDEIEEQTSAADVIY